MGTADGLHDHYAAQGLGAGHPGCVDIVDDGINGFICEVKSSYDLADKMLKMFNMSKEQRNQMALNGRNKVEKFFDEKIVINSYVESINYLIRHEKNI